MKFVDEFRDGDAAAALARAAALPDETTAVDAALALYQRTVAKRPPVPR